MKMKAYRTKKLKKLEELCRKWYSPYTRRDRPKKVTLLMVSEMMRIYQCLKLGQEAFFVVSDLIPYLKKCSIKIDGPEFEKYGCKYVGYVAYLH